MVIHYTDVNDLLCEILQDLPQLAILIINPGQTGGDVAVVLVVVRQTCGDLKRK